METAGVDVRHSLAMLLATLPKVRLIDWPASTIDLGVLIGLH